MQLHSIAGFVANFLRILRKLYMYGKPAVHEVKRIAVNLLAW